MATRTSREKQLASDERAGWSARTSIRLRHRALMRDRWRLLCAFGLVLMVGTLLGAAFATGPVQRGFILGSGTALTFAAVGFLVVLASGTAPLMMGELAEQWTAQELRGLQEHGWKLVNHFGLGYGDHDHVLVGPGGILLVESKWSATPWALNERDHFFQSALAQTLRNARQLQHWHELARHGQPAVEAVLVLWGQAGDGLAGVPGQRHASGVVVLAGERLQDWALRRGRDRLTPERVAAIWASIDRHVDKRDQRERIDRPLPRSMGDVAKKLITCVVVACAGFLIAAQILGSTGSLAAWVGAGAALLVAAELLRRRSSRQWEARAFQAGVLSTYLAGALAVAGTHWSA